MVRILEFLLKSREKSKARLWEQVNHLSFLVFSLPLCLFISFDLFVRTVFSVSLYILWKITAAQRSQIYASPREMTDNSELEFFSPYSKHKRKNLIGAMNFSQCGRGWAYCLAWSWGISWKRGRNNSQKWWSSLYRQTNANWLTQGSTQLGKTEKGTGYQEVKWLTPINRVS